MGRVAGDVSDSDNIRSNSKPHLTASIIVPIWGDPRYTNSCIASLNKTNGNYELMLVDNTGHYDVPAVRNLHALFRNDENLGYADGNNQGAKAATGDVLVFLNCDTEVRFDWLQNLLAAFDDQDVMIAGPRIIHPDGQLQTAGVVVWHGNGQAGGCEIKDDLPTRDVDCVTGACLAIRRSAFDAIGGWNDLYRMGYEDVELCLTARELGFRIRYVREALVVHHESATGPERWVFAHENVALMNERWGNR